MVVVERERVRLEEEEEIEEIGDLCCFHRVTRTRTQRTFNKRTFHCGEGLLSQGGLLLLMVSLFLCCSLPPFIGIGER